MTQRTRTISITVKKKTGDVFESILNIPPKMMPDAKKQDDGWWEFTTQWGPGKLKFNEDKQLGVLDHRFVEEKATWDVPMRVISNGDYSEVNITLNKPESFTDDEFDKRMSELEIMFETMKQIIEKD